MSKTNGFTIGQKVCVKPNWANTGIQPIFVTSLTDKRGLITNTNATYTIRTLEKEGGGEGDLLATFKELPKKFRYEMVYFTPVIPATAP